MIYAIKKIFILVLFKWKIIENFVKILHFHCTKELLYAQILHRSYKFSLKLLKFEEIARETFKRFLLFSF